MFGFSSGLTSPPVFGFSSGLTSPPVFGFSSGLTSPPVFGFSSGLTSPPVFGFSSGLVSFSFSITLIELNKNWLYCSRVTTDAGEYILPPVPIVTPFSSKAPIALYDQEFLSTSTNDVFLVPSNLKAFVSTCAICSRVKISSGPNFPSPYPLIIPTLASARISFSNICPLISLNGFLKLPASAGFK